MFQDMIKKLAMKFGNFITQGVYPRMDGIEVLEKEISRWKTSPQRILQIKGFLYYDGEHDILQRKRTMIGEDGKLQEVDNLPNNRLIDNQYAKMVDQKANYLLGQPFVVECDNARYAKLLGSIFHKSFMRMIKTSGKAAYNGGIVWLYPYYTETGELSFRLFPAYEILPFWKDSEHTRLASALRLYQVEIYQGRTRSIIEKVEVIGLDGIHRFVLDKEKLVPDNTDETGAYCYHVEMMDGAGVIQGFNWERVPLIPLKCNEQETPLLKRVKSLQDGINVMLSDFENNMQEDARNTILVLKNYDGENLGQFRKNLATYGAIKVRYDDSAKGGVETLEVTVNADNYKAILEIFKKALIENAMGYDAKDDRLSGTPNQMNIRSMYSDIEIGANDLETEYQAAFESILWFVNAHLANIGQGCFDGEKVNIIFNRDILMNESEAIENCQKSIGILSDQTIIGQHPWVDDPKAEMERLREQREQEQEELRAQYDPFGQQAGRPSAAAVGNGSGVTDEG